MDQREIILETKEIRKTYKRREVLCGTTMTIHKGDIYGFVGKNGAGKTTLIRILSGLSVADRGSYSIFGISGDDPNIIKARRRSCAMVESPAIYPEMTAKENMKMQCMILRRSSDCIDSHLRFVGLADTGRRKVKDFSLGMRQRLAIAVALIGEPELMLLDEPINGLDPEGIKQIRELLLKLNREKEITILISSHILTELSLFATTYGFIRNGIIVKEVTAEEIFEATAERCYVEADNLERALVRLTALGYKACMQDQGIRVLSDIDLMTVCEDFKNHGIRLTKHIHDAIDLEDYFMKLLEVKNELDPR